MKPSTRAKVLLAMLIFAASAQAQLKPGQPIPKDNDNDYVRPPVSKTDIAIVKRAQEILNSPAVWNRNDNRVCPKAAKTFSLYCALKKATDELTANFEHRGAAMQEARFVIEDVAPGRKYEHRLMGYNNDKRTTFGDIQKVLELLGEDIVKRLAQQNSTGK
jgi:hypothetical protein